MNKKGFEIAFEKIIIIIIGLLVLIAILIFSRGKLQQIIDSFMELIKQIFK